MIVFDKDGKFLRSWGEGVFPRAHGITMGPDDTIFCTDDGDHTVRHCTLDGKVLMTLGISGQPAPFMSGNPFHRCTHLAIDPQNGDFYVSDGYGNARVHRYSADGELILSLGERGDGPGQFSISHCARIDKDDRVWVCDRENNRIQIFDLDGNFLTEWTDLLRPNTVYFDKEDDVVYIAELTHQLSIYSLEQELIAQWGGAKSSDQPGEFIGGPHGLWVDSHGDIYVGEVELGERSRIQKFIRQT